MWQVVRRGGTEVKTRQAGSWVSSPGSLAAHQPALQPPHRHRTNTAHCHDTNLISRHILTLLYSLSCSQSSPFFTSKSPANRSDSKSLVESIVKINANKMYDDTRLVCSGGWQILPRAGYQSRFPLSRHAASISTLLTCDATKLRSHIRTPS